jgi:hypothetical protein
MLVILRQGNVPDKKALIGSLGQIHREAERLQLQSVVKHMDRVKEHLFSKSVTTESLHALVAELYNRMRDEMETRVVVMVDPAKAGLFQQESPLWGQEVADKFPSLSYDIKEAGKCLALERSTASAFHSIRCFEAAIRAISRCLGIPDPTKGSKRNWGAALGSIKDELENRWPSNLIHTGIGEFLWEVHASLSGMQNPYRNSTMHLDKKYTVDEAHHIFEMVKGLTKRLASQIDEDGNPKA